jgi:hypothetical protein
MSAAMLSENRRGGFSKGVIEVVSTRRFAFVETPKPRENIVLFSENRFSAREKFKNQRFFSKKQAKTFIKCLSFVPPVFFLC